MKTSVLSKKKRRPYYKAEITVNGLIPLHLEIILTYVENPNLSQTKLAAQCETTEYVTTYALKKYFSMSKEQKALIYDYLKTNEPETKIN